MNIYETLMDAARSHPKRALPILSFPAVQKLGVTVKQLVGNAELQAKAMAFIAQATDTVAAVSLMDLSVEAEAFGAEIALTDDEVPTVVGALLVEPEDADDLQVPEVGAGRTGLYIEAIGKVMDMITDRPVFAGVIGPFSLAGRLMSMTEIMVNCYEEPEMVEATMEKTTEFLIKYIRGYKDVGANGVVIAEPAAGLMSASLSEEMCWPYVKQIVDAVQDDEFAVILHNCGNAANLMLPEMAAVGAYGYHFGNAVNMKEIVEGMPADVLVMGNVDPANAFRNGTPEKVREQTLDNLNNCTEGHPNFIISSGCDIPPASPWENIDEFFKVVDEWYAAK
ncbi:MAG: uroporphyrinogen decarboxylase family protein [Lachnospiraceae bacterium]|nr:uroporphyrinogen decarboxylase family protein [Lachnospiraceae bacterium]